MATVPRKPQKDHYDSIVRDAVSSFAENGYQGPEELENWLEKIKSSANSQFRPMSAVEGDIKGQFDRIYNRITTKPKGPKNVPKYTKSQLTEEAQAELQKRTYAALEYIKLDREIATANAMRRFAGWASSIPPGGVSEESNKEAVKEITKSLKQLPYRERRVIIDQGHKFSANLNDVVSKGSGAIAAIWHSHVHQAGYNYRKDHAARNERIFLIRGSWADKQGLVKSPSKIGWTDQQTLPAEEVNCRCYYQYLYNLQDLPPEFLTAKGKEVLMSIGDRK